MYVVDASVVYKWYVEEKSSGKAKKILDDFVAGIAEISAPDLLYYEIANALRWNPRNKSEDVKEVIANLDDLDLDIAVPTISFLQEAVDLAYNYKLTLYDAVYIKLAEELKFTFVTADEKLYEKVKGLPGVKLL